MQKGSDAVKWFDEVEKKIIARFPYEMDQLALRSALLQVTSACDRFAPDAPPPEVCVAHTMPALRWIFSPSPGHTVGLWFVIQNNRDECEVRFCDLVARNGGILNQTWDFTRGSVEQRVRRYFEEYPAK